MKIEVKNEKQKTFVQAWIYSINFTTDSDKCSMNDPVIDMFEPQWWMREIFLNTEDMKKKMKQKKN